MLTVAQFHAVRPALLEDLETLVTCESPSSDPAALARCCDLVAGIGARLLGVPPTRTGDPSHPCLTWQFGTGDRVLLLGHLDTVWPLGSLATHPFAVRDGIVTGPGCFDMKAGLVQMLHAVAALPDRDGVTILITSDEEIGSAASRPIIEAQASRVAAALVLEASADAGALKSARKGVSTFELQVAGRAAHAGLEPERGVNATIELAHQVLAIAALGDLGEQTTVTPTVVAGGTTTNTVPAAARVHIDVRAFTVAEQRRVARSLHELRPASTGATLHLKPGEERPPLAASASRELLTVARTVAGWLGLPPIRDVAVGGGSDGNITAGVGTPTLDGLGAVGGGAHADDEHVVIDELAPRTALLAALISELCSSDQT